MTLRRTNAAPGGGITGLLRRARLTVNGGVLVGATLVGWIIARQLGSRTLFLMVYAWALTMAAAWLASRRRLALEVDRSQVPRRMRQGQTIPVDLTVRATRRATTIILEEALPTELGATTLIPISSIGAGQEIEHRYTLTPSLRGIYTIGPCSASWSDPFGLTVHEQHLADGIEVIVHPSTEPVHDRVLTRMWEDPPIRPPVSKPWPTGFEFYGMRDYVPGDDLRRVVWAAVAKTGRMLVRESEQGITDRVAVVLDIDRAWHSPGVPSATFEVGIRTAASVGVHHLKDGFAVSLLTNDGPLVTNLRGGDANFTLLDSLARADRAATPLSAVAPHLMTQARQGTHLLLVTPHVDRDTAEVLRLALSKGVSATVALLVWEETDPQSVNRAASLGCEVVQIPSGESLEAVFANHVGAGARR